MRSFSVNSDTTEMRSKKIIPVFQMKKGHQRILDLKKFINLYLPKFLGVQFNLATLLTAKALLFCRFQFPAAFAAA